MGPPVPQPSRTSAHPRERVVPLEGREPSAACARRAVREQLKVLGRADLVDPAVLCVSELVGNAVRHARGASELSVSEEDGAVRIEVRDHSPVAPNARAAGRTAAPEAESGRGLHIVEVVSADWGVRPIEGNGKGVWCQLR